jgi:glycosyltransferase involved in cell wall biosynthesis
MRIRFSHHIFRLESYGGVSRYFTELHCGLLGRGIDSGVIAPLHINGFLDGLPRVTGVDVRGVRPRVLRQGLAKITDVMWSRRTWSRLSSSDVVHLTYFDEPPSTDARLVTTVYDMVHELFPDGAGRRDATIETKRRTCEAADLVLTISDQTRADLLDRYALDADRVVVTSLGVRPLTLPVGNSAVHRAPFVLYVGDRRRLYKNFEAFVTAFARTTSARDLDMVCFGGGEFAPTEHEVFARLGIGGAMHHASGDDVALARHYASATALIYPSLYEGFGLPPLEGMAYGCPVAAAAVGAIPEVVGPAALLFDPHDQESMADAIDRIVVDDAMRQSLIVSGRSRAAGFSWDDTVTRTLSAYESLLADRPLR